MATDKNNLSDAASELTRKKTVVENDIDEYGFDPNRVTDPIYAMELNDLAQQPETQTSEEDDEDDSDEDEDSDDDLDEEEFDELDPEDAAAKPAVQQIALEDLSEEDQQRYKSLQAQTQALLQKNRMSNYLLLLLIVAYVFCLFFANNWLLLLIIIIPMVGLLIWDHRILKQIRTIQGELRQMGAIHQAAAVKEIRSLNELPKQYTVMDDVIVEDYPVEHVILSPYGIFYIARENIDEKLRTYLDLSEEDVHYISEETPLEEQIEVIMAPQQTTLPETMLMKMAYKLMGMEK